MAAPLLTTVTSYRLRTAAGYETEAESGLSSHRVHMDASRIADSNLRKHGTISRWRLTRGGGGTYVSLPNATSHFKM